MEYQVRKAQMEDVPVILTLYANARRFMAEHGNETQWGQEYPPEILLHQDIYQGNLYVIADDREIHGVFYFSIGADPTYAQIFEGVWHYDDPYGVIHRIAGDGTGGILRTAVQFAFQHIRYLRIDTHADNYVMQSALEKLGFSKCGVIFVEDGSPRIAYDSIGEIREATDEDLFQVLQLYCHLHETDIPKENAGLLESWKQIREDPNHHLLVYEVAGKLVSSCVCVVIPNLTRGVRPYALVENVVTHRNYRGRGYASACLAMAKEISEQAGCYKIMLLTGAKEEEILAFYQNAGYNSSDKTAFIQWLSR